MHLQIETLDDLEKSLQVFELIACHKPIPIVLKTYFGKDYIRNIENLPQHKRAKVIGKMRKILREVME